MSISRLPLALGLFLAAPLAIAASPVGSWTGKFMLKMPPIPANAPPQQKAMIAQAMGQMAKARIMMTFKADKTFSVTMSGIPMQPGNKSESGTWSQKGNVVTTTQKKAGSQPQDLTLDPSGKSMTLTIPGGQGKIVFTK